ncbi:hypothetical protein vBVnaSL3_13 [Vibrio phage vB_VnaS-L3]|nr:hypothetical protein vBVnaSL3_13 [Vibrio phage vB_VnaS-L3]
MKKPTLNKKIVAAIVALAAAIAASFGLYVNQGTQDGITDVACDTVVECSE